MGYSCIHRGSENGNIIGEELDYALVEVCETCQR